MKLRQLAMRLSNLKAHPGNNLDLEQYSITGNLAARWISDILSFGDINYSSTVADLGAGNGILGIGCQLAGAKKSIFFESDSNACKVIKDNLINESLIKSAKVINQHISKDNIPIIDSDIIITNPPWGRQLEKADRPFLDAILASGKTAHILHSSNATHITKLFENAGWSVEKYGEADFALPAKYMHHNRQRGKTIAGFWRVSKD